MTEVALLLFWPALAGYAEAAVAYAGDTVRPGRLVRYAIWGVRLGWLAQTALLVAQAAHADGFPWGTWAGSLNLFVWMCVGVVSHLGLPGAVPAPRARGHAARGAPARARLGGGRRREACAERVRRRLPRLPRRPDPGRLRRLHPRREPRGALSLAGAQAEAAQRPASCGSALRRSRRSIADRRGRSWSRCLRSRSASGSASPGSSRRPPPSTRSWR